MTNNTTIDPRNASPVELTAAIAAGHEIAIIDPVHGDEYSLESLSCPDCGVWLGCVHAISDCHESPAHLAMAGADAHRPGCGWE